MKLGSREHLDYCARQQESCRLAASDESLTVMDRVGAQIGELDWITAEAVAREGAIAELTEYVTSEMCSSLESRLKQIEHREAFIQDLSALTWMSIPSFTPSSILYYADVAGECTYYIKVHYVVGSPYCALVTTSEDTSFQYTTTVDEAKQIVGNAWRGNV